MSRYLYDERNISRLRFNFLQGIGFRPNDSPKLSIITIPLASNFDSNMRTITARKFFDINILLQHDNQSSKSMKEGLRNLRTRIILAVALIMLVIGVALGSHNLIVE